MKRREDRFKELCAAWVLGALEEDDLHEFEALWKDADPVMRTIRRGLEETALHLPVSVPAAEPPARLKRRILQAVRAQAPSPAAALPWIGGRVAVLTSVGLAVLVVVLAILSGNLFRALDRGERRIAELTAELERKELLLEILASQEAQVLILEGLGSNPQGHGKLIWDASGGDAILQVSSLPAVPDESVYQVWVFGEEGPESAGTFPLRATGKETFLRIQNLTRQDKQSITGVLITLEPRGGAQEPGGARYLGAHADF